MVLSKILKIYLSPFFMSDKVFGNFVHRKLAFLAFKTSILKSRKIGIFPKGLVHGFGQNYEIFSSLIFR